MKKHFPDLFTVYKNYHSMVVDRNWCWQHKPLSSARRRYRNPISYRYSYDVCIKNHESRVPHLRTIFYIVPAHLHSSDIDKRAIKNEH